MMQKEGKTMIKYKLDVQEELKKKGYTSYIIRKNKYLSEGTLAKIKRGEPINMKSLNAICCMLRKNVDDVIDIEITDDEKIKYFI
jgi:putative transcriptional regulator